MALYFPPSDNHLWHSFLVVKERPSLLHSYPSMYTVHNLQSCRSFFLWNRLIPISKTLKWWNTCMLSWICTELLSYIFFKVFEKHVVHLKCNMVCISVHSSSHAYVNSLQKSAYTLKGELKMYVSVQYENLNNCSSWSASYVQKSPFTSACHDVLGITTNFSSWNHFPNVQTYV